ncbi:MAG: ATP-binding protein [Spirochaetia bacterium]|nr:ATP-binding protein [Spirochaetia bacterium]
MKIAIASGKGGTGKTTVAVNLAAVIQGSCLIDCDVEEPNAALYLNPKIEEINKVELPVPRLKEDGCSYCGLCARLCAFGAISVLPGSAAGKGTLLVFDHLCKSCGVCMGLCPERALKEELRAIGTVETGNSCYGTFARGQLDIGEVAAPALIRVLKQKAIYAPVTIIDAPPGTSCAMINTINGVDLCVLVTEPTPFGLNDLKLAVEAVRKASIPFCVVINRSMGDDEIIEQYCRAEGAEIAAKIPFNMEMARRSSEGGLLCATGTVFRDYFTHLAEKVQKT